MSAAPVTIAADTVRGALGAAVVDRLDPSRPRDRDALLLGAYESVWLVRAE